MLIERIEPVDKKRKLIQLDSGESFVLYVGEIRLLRLEENKELQPEIYDRILKTVLPKRAKLRVMNLLKTRPYTEYQLTKKLKDGGYPDEVILIAIEYVKSYGYVNDKQYAIDYIRSQAKNRSKKELYMKLQQKGIHATINKYGRGGLVDEVTSGIEETRRVGSSNRVNRLFR